MIMIDYSQIILSTLFVSLGNHTNTPIDENSIRHMCLNVLRSVRKKYHKEFGELVICTDGKGSWRRELFPYYKAGRKKTRDESELDWENLFRIINTIREELETYFPYKVIHVDCVEADDIIGTLCHKYGTLMNTGEQILIYSTDKDYIQLHVYGNVRQFNPVLKKWIQNPDPEFFLKEHILRGDSSDGVPNVLSPDNAFAIGERQKPITKKKLPLLLDEANMDELTRIRYHRNKMMIDLSCIPLHYKEEILTQFEKEPNGRQKMFNYFVDKRLTNLLSQIQDF